MLNRSCLSATHQRLSDEPRTRIHVTSGAGSVASAVGVCLVLAHLRGVQLQLTLRIVLRSTLAWRFGVGSDIIGLVSLSPARPPPLTTAGSPPAPLASALTAPTPIHVRGIRLVHPFAPYPSLAAVN
ncbi:hypothetical protein HYQ46_007754 [Verticillium longisporum]|nr:hypothetical protein HYQ46_007754 [Verticillium longisporum]